LNEGFIFECDNQEIYLGELIDTTLAKLGDPENYYEYDSCSFEGLAKIYYYSGFEIANYVKPSESESETQIDRLYSISLVDDSVKTKENVYIGQEWETAKQIYNNLDVTFEDYIDIGGFARYIKNGTVLIFNVDGNGIIIGITYQVEDMYAE